MLNALSPILLIPAASLAVLGTAGCQSEPYGVRLLTPATSGGATGGAGGGVAAASSQNAADRYTAATVRASVTESEPVVIKGQGVEYRLVGKSRLVVYIFNPGADSVEIDAGQSSVTAADGSKLPVEFGGSIGPGRFIRLLLPPPIYEAGRAGDPIARSQSAGREYGLMQSDLDATVAPPATATRDAWPWAKGTTLTLTLTYQRSGQVLTDQLQMTR
jgi:hypothetical protein